MTKKELIAKCKLKDIVKILWADAATKDDWVNVNNVIGPEEVVSVGIVIHTPTRDEDYIVIVQAIDEPNGTMFGQLLIPFKMVLQLKVLK